MKKQISRYAASGKAILKRKYGLTFPEKYDIVAIVKRPDGTHYGFEFDTDIQAHVENFMLFTHQSAYWLSSSIDLKKSKRYPNHYLLNGKEFYELCLVHVIHYSDGSCTFQIKG